MLEVDVLDTTANSESENNLARSIQNERHFRTSLCNASVQNEGDFLLSPTTPRTKSFFARAVYSTTIMLKIGGIVARLMDLWVWDFHGVLERGTECAVLEISNLALERHGFDCRFSFGDIMSLYGRLWHEYFAYLLPERPDEVHLALQQCCYDIQQEYPHIIPKHILPTEHAFEVLDYIRNRHNQILISNTNSDHIDFFVDSVGMTGLFDCVIGVDRHGDPSLTKSAILDQYVQGKEYRRIFSVGDSPKDVELARSREGIGILYAHPGRAYRDCDADLKTSDLREVLRFV